MDPKEYWERHNFRRNHTEAAIERRKRYEQSEKAKKRAAEYRQRNKEIRAAKAREAYRKKKEQQNQDPS